MKKAFARLGKPRKVEFDASFLAACESARYRINDYSDAHWFYQVCQMYRESFGPYRAAAEKVMRIFLRVGAKAAIKEAELLDECRLPRRVRLRKNTSWKQTCQAMMARDGD